MTHALSLYMYMYMTFYLISPHWSWMTSQALVATELGSEDKHPVKQASDPLQLLFIDTFQNGPEYLE